MLRENVTNPRHSQSWEDIDTKFGVNYPGDLLSTATKCQLSFICISGVNCGVKMAYIVQNSDFVILAHNILIFLDSYFIKKWFVTIVGGVKGLSYHFCEVFCSLDHHFGMNGVNGRNDIIWQNHAIAKVEEILIPNHMEWEWNIMKKLVFKIWFLNLFF